MSFSKICILVNYNLYESKRYFAKKFAEALLRHGLKPRIIDSNIGTNVKEQLAAMMNPEQTDLTCSFNSAIPLDDGTFIWDRTHIPHWSILVDPSFYSEHYLSSPYSIVSCVDHYDCEYVSRHHFQNVFFWPHAVERELIAPENNSRPYDVVFLGSCYDHENLRQYWQKKMPKKHAAAIDEAVEIVLHERDTPLIRAIHQALLNHHLDSSEVDFKEIFFYVDNYMRGKDRTELIRSIKDVHVHVFGGTCWRSHPPVRGWGHTLSSMRNVSIHPTVTFSESLEILKQSKICLNSMPFFKNGTHERIFTGLACGSVPVTTDNQWIQENFIEEEELLIYRPFHWDMVNDQIKALLSNEEKRKQIAAQGREKVMLNHTWDNRVEEMLVALKPILAKL
jgi:spore maturation protein CgeB